MDWAGRAAGFAPSVAYHHSPANRLVKSRPDKGGFRICPCFSVGLSFSADDCDDGGPVPLQDRRPDSSDVAQLPQVCRLLCGD